MMNRQQAYQLLYEPVIRSYLLKYKSECNDNTLFILDSLMDRLDFSSVFIGNMFKIAHILLQHPIQEMYSYFFPDISLFGSMSNPNWGFLLVMNKDLPEDADNISWQEYSKSDLPSPKVYDVARIIYCKGTNSYQLYSTDQMMDEYDEIMERITWRSTDGKWTKFQYRILQKYVITSDNGDYKNEVVQPRPLPSLFHYIYSEVPIYIPTNPSLSGKDIKVENVPEDVSYHEVMIAPDTNISLPYFKSPTFAYRTNQPMKLNLQILSPSYGFSSDGSYCILFLPGVNENNYYNCRLADGTTIPANMIGKETLEVYLPPHSAGFVSFYVVGVNSLNELMQITNPVDFAYLPSGSSAQLNLDSLLVTYPRFFDQLHIFKYTTTVIYLGNNSLTNLDFLTGFQVLEILILNNNELHENTKFPNLPSLKELSINGNLILDFAAFATKNKDSLSQIKTLETLQNPCNPYLKSDNYGNYRKMVLQYFPQLEFLDSSPITEEDRKALTYNNTVNTGNVSTPVPQQGQYSSWPTMDIDFNDIYIKPDPLGNDFFSDY
eukprot:TRINITY_DN2663_c0_g2_i1.p1 TRINITY_DN2663_c0_g2~~TRINITY_DN2663_c0_g2_i1.p1  ORF type:complete len:575 (+),score=100.78 TRINITY_DN2663_c0_g2_i1:82-1725(+)